MTKNNIEETMNLIDFDKTRNEISSAIKAERMKQAKYISFRVEKNREIGDFWALNVEPISAKGTGIDESFEGSLALWSEPYQGAADVLSVIPHEMQINLRFATSVPPDKGKTINIRPPQHLKCLEDYWKSNELADISLRWIKSINNNNSYDPEIVPPYPKTGFRLRERQALAFELTGWDLGFMWGPPGTGKTYTIGIILAQCILSNNYVVRYCFFRQRTMLLIWLSFLWIKHWNQWQMID